MWQHVESQGVLQRAIVKVEGSVLAVAAAAAHGVGSPLLAACMCSERLFLCLADHIILLSVQPRKRRHEGQHGEPVHEAIQS